MEHVWSQFHLHPCEKSGPPCTDFQETHKCSIASRVMSYTIFHHSQTVIVESMNRNSFTPLCMVWLLQHQLLWNSQPFSRVLRTSCLLNSIQINKKYRQYGQSLLMPLSKLWFSLHWFLQNSRLLNISTWRSVISQVWWSKSGTPVLTERLVTEENWYKAHSGHLRIDIHDTSQNSWSVERLVYCKLHCLILTRKVTD
jgi:hypothetical protein